MEETIGSETTRKGIFGGINVAFQAPKPTIIFLKITLLSGRGSSSKRATLEKEMRPETSV